MATSEQLRKNKKQHIPKNTKSKIDDKRIYEAMHQCINYLENRFEMYLKKENFELEFSESISFKQLIHVIKSAGSRKEFDDTFNARTIRPDGGIIFLKKRDDPDYLRIVLISEVKRQGTNDQRMREGKGRQAQGNAIERLGKNLIGIRAALNHEPITPFACFGWGCDFVKNYDKDAFVMSKISMMNEFYPLNKIYVKKQHGSSDKNFFAPVSMFFKEKQWKVVEMFEILKEIGETALRHYIF